MVCFNTARVSSVADILQSFSLIDKIRDIVLTMRDIAGLDSFGTLIY